MQGGDGIRLGCANAVALQGGQHLRDDLWRLQDAPHFGHDRVLDHSGSEPQRRLFRAALAVPDDIH